MTVQYRGDADPTDEMLSAYLDGDLSATEHETLRAALETDAALRERYHELAATVSLLRDLPVPVPRRSFTLTAEQAREVRTANGIAVRQLIDDGPPVVRPFTTPTVPLTAPATATSLSGQSPPANVTSLRPQSPVARLVPLFGAWSAVAAVLLFAVLTMDFAGGGGDRAAAPQTAGRAAEESVTSLTPAPTFAIAPTANPAGAPAPAIARSMPGDTTTAAQATAATTSSAPGTSDANAEDTNPLVRVAEIALALLLLTGIAGLIVALRARGQVPSPG